MSAAPRITPKMADVIARVAQAADHGAQITMDFDTLRIRAEMGGDASRGTAGDDYSASFLWTGRTWRCYDATDGWQEGNQTMTLTAWLSFFPQVAGA